MLNELRNKLSSFSLRPTSQELIDTPTELRVRVLYQYHDFFRLNEIQRIIGVTDFWEHLYHDLVFLHPTDGRLTHPGDASNRIFLFSQECDTNQFYDVIETSFKALAKARTSEEQGNTSSCREDWSGIIGELIECINLIFERGNGQCRLTSFSLDPIQETPPLNAIPHDSLPFGVVPARKFQYYKIARWPQVYVASESVIQQEAVEPALRILDHPSYLAANQQFCEALNDYRQYKYDSCTVHCNNAFESVLKVLCKKNKWAFREQDTAGVLLKQVVRSLNLDKGVEKLLVGIPIIRNNTGGHGPSEPTTVEPQIA